VQRLPAIIPVGAVLLIINYKGNRPIVDTADVHMLAESSLFNGDFLLSDELDCFLV